MVEAEYEQLLSQFGMKNPIVQLIQGMAPEKRGKVDPIRAQHIARWTERDQADGRLQRQSLTLESILMSHK